MGKAVGISRLIFEYKENKILGWKVVKAGSGWNFNLQNGVGNLKK